MANRDYWRNVGDLEMEAVLDIETCILGISESLSPVEYREQIAPLHWRTWLSNGEPMVKMKAGMELRRCMR